MYRDLREFIEVLKKEKQLVTVPGPVMPEPDLGAIGRAAPDTDRGPAVLVEKVAGYPNPVLLNVHGSWRNHALMLGMPANSTVRGQCFELDRRWSKYPLKPVWVSEEEAPVKEVKITENVNLFDVMALFRINESTAASTCPKRSPCRATPTTRIISTSRTSAPTASRSRART